MSFIAKFSAAALLVPALTASASAMTVASVASLSHAQAVVGDGAAIRYFDVNALVTLGALAIAGGAMAAFGALAARRRAALEAEPAWRVAAIRAVEADLAAFTLAYRRAA